MPEYRNGRRFGVYLVGSDLEASTAKEKCVWRGAKAFKENFCAGYDGRSSFWRVP